MHRFEEGYPADPAAIGTARTQLAAYAAHAGAGEALTEDVRLAVSEAVTNAVRHGYRGAPGEIQVSAEAGPRELVIVVRDSGVGLDAPPFPGGSGLGCGLRIIRGVCDALEVRRPSGGGTELRMRFALVAPHLALALVA